MNPSDIKVIAFDLDGTLIDSVPDLAAATQATLKELTLPLCSEQQVRSWVGNGARILMKRALSWSMDTDVSDEYLDNAMPKFLRHYQDYLEKHSRLYPDVVTVLDVLKAQGYPMALVTNKPYRFTVPLLQAFGLDNYFSLVLGGDSLAEMKPSPLPLQKVITEFGIAANQLLMVGDSRNDILAAKAAGAASIGLTYGYNYGEDIGSCGPDAVCNDFSEILAILESRQAVLEH